MIKKVKVNVTTIFRLENEILKINSDTPCLTPYFYYKSEIIIINPSETTKPYPDVAVEGELNIT